MKKSYNKSMFDKTLGINSDNYNQYALRLYEMCLSRGVWTMPDTVDTRYLETTLCRDGQAVFFRDDVLGYIVLPLSTRGKLDVYGNPSQYYAIGINGYRVPLDNTNSVIIYNNYTRTGNIYDINIYANRLYDCDGVIDVNIRSQKTPTLVICDESEKIAMQNVYKKIDGNEPAIFAKRNFDANNIRSISTGAPFVADKIYEMKMNIWNEALTALGIPNSNYEKKERVITDEVTRSQGATIACRNSPEKMRQQACEKINKMFGLDCWYHFDILKTEGGDTK